MAFSEENKKDLKTISDKLNENVNYSCINKRFLDYHENIFINHLYDKYLNTKVLGYGDNFIRHLNSEKIKDLNFVTVNYNQEKDEYEFKKINFFSGFEIISLDNLDRNKIPKDKIEKYMEHVCLYANTLILTDALASILKK